MHPQTESAPPEAEQESTFFEEIEEIWTVGEVIWVVLACDLRRRLKKEQRSSTFSGRKVHRPRQNPGYAYGVCLTVNY